MWFIATIKERESLKVKNRSSVLSTIHCDIKILCSIILWLSKNKRVRCSTTAVVVFDFKIALQKSQSSGTDPTMSFFFQFSVFSILGCFVGFFFLILYIHIYIYTGD